MNGRKARERRRARGEVKRDKRVEAAAHNNGRAAAAQAFEIERTLEQRRRARMAGIVLPGDEEVNE